AAVWPPRGSKAALWEWAYCWAQLSRFFERSSHSGSTGDVAKEDIAALLLAREPVRVRIGSRRIVGITSRSLAAMEALARYELRRRLLAKDLEHVAAL